MNASDVSSLAQMADACYAVENPGVAETLVPNESVKSEKSEGRRRYVLNQRFAWDTYYTDHFLGILKKDEQIVDLNKKRDSCSVYRFQFRADYYLEPEK
jgi:hypothetical protein